MLKLRKRGTDSNLVDMGRGAAHGMCWSRSQAERALERLTALLAGSRPGAKGGQNPHRAPGGRRPGV